MQQLHLVGFTTDLDQLILSVRKGAKSGSYLVPLDDRLLAEIAEAVRRRSDDQATGTAPPLELPPEVAAAARPAGERTRPTSSLTGREIQARLRSGRSITEVAKEAGADEEWITKFASPVIAERAQIIRAARQLVFSKPRRGPSAESLGASVRWNLADRGVRLTDEEFDACWDAYLVGDALWGVTFDAVTRGRQHHAVWEVDLREVEVFARNRAASDFGFVENARRRNPPALATEAKPARRDAPARSTGSTARATRARTGSTSSRTAKATKATKKQAARRSGGRGAPPASPPSLSRSPALSRSSTPARSQAPAVAPTFASTPPPPTTPVPNELAKHRLRLVQSERAGERPSVRSRPVPPRAAPRPPLPRPTAPPPREPPPPTAPPTRSGLEAEIASTPDDEAARQRREERRRARAAAREANGSTDTSRTTSFEPPPVAGEPKDDHARRDRDRSRADGSGGDGDGQDDARVVTIRASRAGSTATAADNGRDVIVRGGKPALRPARPAVQPVQPRRRRFGRSR